MPSSLSRYDIVVEALTRAGRGIELRSLAEGMLNRMLRQWAFEYKYPELRKIAAVSALVSGANSAQLPADFGAGVEKLSLGSDQQSFAPLTEMAADDFFQLYQPTDVNQRGAGAPTTFYVDRSNNQLFFNAFTDRSYAVSLIYYAVPADIEIGSSLGDQSKVWMSDDELVIQGLIAKIYQYNQDIREKEQVMYVEALKNSYRRGTVPSGAGTNRIRLSRRRFRTRSR